MKVKMKTNRGAAKRFKVTANGKVKFKRTKLRHILSSKSTTLKRGLRKAGYIKKCEEHLIKQILPYA